MKKPRLSTLFNWLFRRGGMKRMILFPFMGLIAVGFLTSWILYTESSRATVLKAVDELALESAKRTRDRIQAYVERAAQVARYESALAAMPGLGLEEGQKTLWRLLGGAKDVDIAAIGYADGSYIEAELLEDGSVATGLASRSTGRALVSKARDRLGRPLGIISRVEDYDPRQRPWYGAAEAAGRPFWISPYALKRSGSLAIASAAPVYDESGRLRAVAVTSIKLSRVSDYLFGDSFVHGGLSVVLDQSGRTIAASSGAISPPILQALARAPASEDEASAASIGGEPCRLVVLDADLAKELPWRLAVVLPVAQFLGDFPAMDKRTALVFVTMLAMAIALAFIAAARIASPLRRLGEAVAAIDPAKAHRGEARSIAVLSRRDDEIGRLAARFAELSERIEEDFAAQRHSLEEKELLLRELSHRVKNNLQIISSLLASQASALEEGPLRENLVRLDDRIQAMAYVHEDVCDSGDASSVDMDRYFERICDTLASGRRAAGPIKVEVRESGLLLPANLAMPCGLIVNELVANSMRHAFAGRPAGSIAVSLSREGDYLLAVEDDGSGFPAEGLSGRARTGMGLSLVDALAAQIGGRLSIESGPAGTRAEICFSPMRS